MKSGRPIHPSNGSGTAPDAAVTPEGVLISFSQGPNRSYQTTTSIVSITNRDAANTLEVSFANGRDKTWFAIATDTTVTLPISCHNCRLRGSSGAVALYSVMGIIA
jgi:hypothetical protein